MQFVPSTPRAIALNPMAAIYAAPERNDPDTLREPLLEGLAFLRQGKVTPDVSPRSTLNWSNYITSLTTKGPDAARPHLLRFVNTDEGWDAPDAYLGTLHDRPIHSSTINVARGVAANEEADSTERVSTHPDHRQLDDRRALAFGFSAIANSKRPAG